MERSALRSTATIKHLSFKVGLLLVLTAALGLGTIVYALHARGVFEVTHRLVLIARDADDLRIGLPLTFSGFPIGKVSRIALADDGKVRVELDIPIKQTRWLRESSVFTLEKTLLGAARIRVHGTDLNDELLADEAERALIRGDATDEIPALIGRLKRILDNAEAITAADSSLNASLSHLRTITESMTQEHGVLQGVLGSPEKAREFMQTIERVGRLSATLESTSHTLDRLLAKTEQRIHGAEGLMDQSQQALQQVNSLLNDAQGSLRRIDGILAQTQKASANAADLRAEVDDSLRKLNHLIDEINRRWPFSREVEIQPR